MEIRHKCLCCGYQTITHDFDICPVCYWQKDFYQEKNIEDNGGPNLVSLKEARENFKKNKVSDLQYKSLVRSPLDNEK